MAKNRRKRRDGKRREIRLTPQEGEELLRIVKDDLLFLKDVEFESPSRTEIRVASGILRRLLGDGMLAAAWEVAGFTRDFVIEAPDLQQMLADVPDRYIHYAYAGGAKTRGAQHTGYMLLVIPKAEAEAEGVEAVTRRLQQAFKPGRRRAFTLAQYCQSPAVISGKASVSRLGVVRYVANKLGGVHWDNRRGAWTDPVGGRHRLLDEGHLIVGRLPGTLYEVLSVAQALADSADTAALIAKVDQVAPEDERAENVLSFREGRIGTYADLTFNTSSEEPGATE